VPDENLLLDRTEHYQNQTDRSQLRENAKDQSETSGDLSRAQKIVKPLLIPMDLLRPSGSWKCFHPLIMNTIPTMVRKRRRAISVKRDNCGNIMSQLYSRREPRVQQQNGNPRTQNGRSRPAERI
jgi:hypothetical protein